MHYLFRDVAYRSRIIRFIKPSNIDSDGPRFTTNVRELQVISQYIEYREPLTIVIALLGMGAVGCSKADKTRGPDLEAFQREYCRLPDSYYEWQVAELVID